MDHNHSHGGEDGDCVSPHAMTFHAGVCQEILFAGWVTTSALQLAGSAAAVLVVGVLYEALKYFRETLYAASAPRASQINIAKSECGAPGGCAQTALVKQSMWSQSHSVQTVLHALQTTLSYLLMLIFMTYNVWLCLALVLGLTCGFFLFGWRKRTAVDVTEHCQ